MEYDHICEDDEVGEREEHRRAGLAVLLLLLGTSTKQQQPFADHNEHTEYMFEGNVSRHEFSFVLWLSHVLIITVSNSFLSLHSNTSS